MKTLKSIFLVLTLAVFTFSCSSDDDNGGTPPAQPLNIVETAQASANLSILVEAAIQAGLVDALSADGPMTVLAPTNLAFTNFLADKGFDSLEDVPNDVLKQILLNHVIDGEVPSSALSGSMGYTNTMATGPNGNNLSLYYNGVGGVEFNGASSVLTADVDATNGIVHIVDAVIDIPTLLTFATADDTFASLEASVLLDSQSGVAAALTNATQASPLTVLAPTNDAFTALLDSNNDWNGPADIDAALLTAVLTHHVTAGNVASADLTNPGTTTAASVQGQDFSITLPGTNGNIADVTDGAGNTDIGIIAVDVQASNGVIHAVNKVLLPAQ
ncbi:fasciclin domain-containing protein [Lacinutrix salivirga]